MSDFKLGQSVAVQGKKLVRRLRRKDGEDFKVWEETPFALSSAIFLGYRYLKNGHLTYSYEEGCLFHEHERFKAALVCYSVNENPIYVMADDIQPHLEEG